MDLKAEHCIIIVSHRANLSQPPAETEQPEHTLPHPPGVYWKPLKYRYLHITDAQQWSQWCLLYRGSTVMYKYYQVQSYTGNIVSLFLSVLLQVRSTSNNTNSR